MAQRLSLSEVTGTEPIGLPEAKAHLRVDQSDEDTLIGSLIAAAREGWEDEIDRQLAKATYVLTLDGFPASGEAIELPRPPLLSVTSITYLDSTGAEVPWDAAEYTVKAQNGPRSLPGRVYPGAAHDWPSTQDVPGAVAIEYEAGYEDGTVPEIHRAAVLLILGDLYANRESQVVGNVFSDNKTLKRMASRYRLPVVA